MKQGYRSFIPGMALVLSSICAMLLAPSQAAAYTRNHVEYLPGDLPVILAVPHGGSEGLLLASPICGSGATDQNTIELARQIRDDYYALYGRRPYVIINHFQRKYLDPSRDPGPDWREKRLYEQDRVTGEIECDLYGLFCKGSGNVWSSRSSKSAWYEFHGRIDAAKADILKKYSARQQVLFIDLHGYFHSDFIQLGYILRADSYIRNGRALPENEKNGSSLRHLSTNRSLEELLRGGSSFGAILEKHMAKNRAYGSYPCVPSPSQRKPWGIYYNNGWDLEYHTGVELRHPRKWFSGDYNEARMLIGHKNTSGFQIEVPTALRIDEEKRAYTSRALAKAIEEYRKIHYPAPR